MSKFNQNNTGQTVNISGNKAYKMDAKTKLVTQVLTSFFNEAKFYGDNSDQMRQLIAQAASSDPEFVSRLAVFARREFNMRSVAHVLTAYLAHTVEGKPFVRRTVRGVALRGDDLTEIMAFYLNTFGKPIPNSLKKGINDVLVGFDEYTLAKYKGSGKAVKMRDLLCLCRPTPRSEAQSAMWKRCLEDELATPVTWETQLSAKGNNAETWKELIDSGKVGYMALLRNLRNILNAKPDNIDKVYRTIADSEAVRHSRQLPFRFLSAYKSVKDIAGGKLFSALEKAVDASLENLPRLEGTTVIAIDVSGSMGGRISARSDITCAEIATMLGLCASRICEDSMVFTFDTEIRRMPVSDRTGILYATLNSAHYGGGTNMFLPFEQMLAEKIKADRVIILSDNECNSGSTYFSRATVQQLADAYRKESGCDIWVHAIDMQGYGTQQFKGAKTNIIAGCSEKVFDFIKLAEQGEGSLVKAIENYAWQ